MKREQLRLWILTVIFAALSFTLSSLIVFPNMAPIQHAMNVIAAIHLGPFYAFMQALLTGVLRMMTGRSVNAVIGAVFGALLAGIFYRLTKRRFMALIGEVIGTGFISAYVSFLVMKYLLGVGIPNFYYYVPFFLPSSIIGSVFGLIIAHYLRRFEPDA